MHDAAEADRVAAQRARSRAAEDRIYPLVVVDPEGYQRVVALIAMLLDELRSQARTVDELIAMAETTQLLSCLPADRSTAVPDETLLAAACGIRDRELAAAADRQRAEQIVVDARAAGRAWAVLVGPEDMSGLTSGQRTELHITSGTALIGIVDPWSGCEPLQLQQISAGGTGRERSFTDRSAWLETYRRWHAEIE